GILPPGHRALDRFDRLVAAEHDGLAVRLDLFAAPRREIGVPERVGVTQGMRHGLTERVPLGLQLLAGVAPLLPGRRVFLRPVADFVPPRGTVDNLQTDDRVRDSEPFLAVIGDRLCGFVIAALRLAALLADIAAIDDALGIQLRARVDRAADVAP